MKSKNNKQYNNIVFFDGICGLCNRAVNFLIKIDKYNRLVFTPLQGETIKQYIPNLDIDKLDTIIYWHNNIVYYKSDAVLKILESLGGIWKLIVVFKIVPKPIRDFVYTIIANNRYKWFGKKETCRIPLPHEREKFLI